MPYAEKYEVPSDGVIYTANRIRAKGVTGDLEWKDGKGFGDAVDAIPTGSGGSYSYNESLVRNWDFTNPVNTRGYSSYSSTSDINAINGWKSYYLTLNLTENGIQYSNFGSSNNGNFYCQSKMTLSDLQGKGFTLSALIDGELYSTSFTMRNSTGSAGSIAVGNPLELTVGCNVDSTSVLSVFFYNHGKTTTSKLLQAIKLEYGDTQTLAHQENGVWMLNKHSTPVEQHFIRQLCNNF